VSSFLLALKNYAVFTGRSRRREYWMFVLFSFLISAALTLVDLAIGTYSDEGGIGLLGGLFGLAMLIPQISLNTRRFHDIGKSGWYQLLFIIPCIGIILWLVWMASDSEPGMNKYGPNPNETQTA